MEPGVQYYGLTVNVADGAGGPALLGLLVIDHFHLFPVSLSNPQLSHFPFINPLSLSLSLPLMMIPKVDIENLGKIVVFCELAL